MDRISSTSSSFVAAMQRRESIGITPDGKWYKKGFLSKIASLFCTLFWGYDEAYENAKNLIHSLSSPEIISLGKYNGLRQNSDWESEDLRKVVHAVKESIHNSVEREEQQIHALKEKREALKAHLTSQLPQTPITDLNKLIFNAEAWAYRSTAATLDRLYLQNLYLGFDQQNIEKTDPLPEDYSWLTDQLAEWQSHQFPCVRYVNGKNSDDVKMKILHCCRYRDFIALARNNTALLDLFFEAVFKRLPDSSTYAVDIFIQAMDVHKRLYDTGLDKRLHELNNNGIQFGQIGCTGDAKPIKDVKLLINGEYQSIADKNSALTIAPGVTRTVANIEAEFIAQIARFIVIEYLQDKGVYPFDGRLLDFNFDKEEWWKDLPIIKRMTRKEIEDAFHVSTQDDYAPSFVCASRTTPDLNANENHSWIELCIPLDDGTFNVVGISKFSDWFPVTLCEAFYHVYHTHLGYVTLLETNTFELCRDRLAVRLPPLTKQHFESVMEYLRDLFLRSRRKELIFQAGGDNCASEVMKFIRHNWPGLDIEPFATKALEMSLPSIFNLLITCRSLFPTDAAWDEFRRFFGWLSGSLSTYPRADGKGGIVNECLAGNEYYQQGITQLPARLWLEKEKITKRVEEYTKEHPAIAEAVAV